MQYENQRDMWFHDLAEML